MMRRRLLTVLACSTVLAAAHVAAAAEADQALAVALAAPTRNKRFAARDPVRHPAEELAFFGLRPDASVVEILPGGGYWTEILAPYLADRGSLAVALEPGDDGKSQVERFRAKFAGKPGFGGLRITELDAAHSELAPAGTVDLVLTFRNVHNWMADGYVDQAFAAFFTALKPGGILGVEEHRGLASVPQDPKAQNGYVRQDYVVALAEKAGFKLVDSSEIGANPRDTKDYPSGVWTLPPRFALNDVDRARYAAIGEADNMTLKFRKP